MDQYKVPLMKLVQATRGKKARRVDRKGKGRVGSDDSDSEKSERSSESTSSSDSSEASSEESTSEEEEKRKRMGEVKEGKNDKSKRRKRRMMEKRGKRVKGRNAARRDEDLTRGLRKEIEKLKEEKAREERLRAEKGGASSGGDMSELTAQMKALALMVNELAKRPATTTSAQASPGAGGPPFSNGRPPRGPLDPDRPRNCYVCDSTEHQTRICPVFDEMIKLGWPLKKENGYVVVRTEDGVLQDVGVGYGRGGIAAVLVQKFPHLQVRPSTETGNVRMAVLEMGHKEGKEAYRGLGVEKSSEWEEWQKKYGGRKEEGNKTVVGKTYASKIVVDSSGWESLRERVGADGNMSMNTFMATGGRKDGEAGKISIDARIGGEVTPVVRTILRAKNVSLFEVELARAHLEIKTGYRGRGVMPLDDFIGVVGGMSERQRGVAEVYLGKRDRNDGSDENTTRKNAKLRVAEESGSAMSLDEDAVRQTAGKIGVAAPTKEKGEGPRVSWGPKESVSVKRMGRGTEVLKPVDKGKGDGNKAVTGAAEEKRGPTFRYLSQLQEGIPNASREIAESILNTPVMVTAGQLLSMSGVRKEIQKVTNLRKVSIPQGNHVSLPEASTDDDDGDDEMEYLERTLFGAVGEARFVEMDIGDAWHGEADAEEVNGEETREDGYSRLEGVGEEGRKNDLRKWPKIRPLVTQSPHLTEVEVVSMEGGLYIPRVPNDDGSQMNLVSRGLASEIEKRGVSIHWGFTFNMRSANGTIDKLEGMIPNLPVFVGGVRFEISALVVGDNAPFALLWGSPANQAAATRTVRDPRTKEMTVWMQNPGSCTKCRNFQK